MLVSIIHALMNVSDFEEGCKLREICKILVYKHRITIRVPMCRSDLNKYLPRKPHSTDQNIQLFSLCMSHHIPPAPVNLQRSVSQPVEGILSSASSASQLVPTLLAVTHQAGTVQGRSTIDNPSTSTVPSMAYRSLHTLSCNELYDVHGILR